MHQRDHVRKAWADAGLYDTKDAKLRELLKHVDEAPMECWSDLAHIVRTRYPEYLEKLVAPIWATGDKLLRLNLIRNLDMARADEKKFVQGVVRKLRLDAEALELRAVVHVAPLDVLDTIARRRGLPDHLRLLVDTRRARLVP